MSNCRFHLATGETHSCQVNRGADAEDAGYRHDPDETNFAGLIAEPKVVVHLAAAGTDR
jgi:hypothetical protein